MIPVSYREISRTKETKLVLITFKAPGYPIGDGRFRTTDTWSMPVAVNVQEEIARILNETDAILLTKTEEEQPQEPNTVAINEADFLALRDRLAGK